MRGVEPLLPFGNNALNVARLPITPHRHDEELTGRFSPPTIPQDDQVTSSTYPSTMLPWLASNNLLPVKYKDVKFDA